MFWDRTIQTGRTFEAVIEEAIGSANAVVVLWSRHSIPSEWVRAEASEGANRGILVPATLDDEPPPLRYRIAQTADLRDWSPGSQTDSFTAFITDVAETALGSDSTAGGRGVSDDRDYATRSTLSQHRILAADRSIRQHINTSLAFAWSGSLSLAVTLAYDYRVITNAGSLWALAYWLTLVSLMAGAVSSGLLGALS